MSAPREVPPSVQDSRAILVAGDRRGTVPERPGSVLILPHGTGIGEMALQRGLFLAVRRRWPEADVAVHAPDRVRPLVPAGIRLATHVAGQQRRRWALWTSRALGMLGPLESRGISLATRAAPLHRVIRVPAMVRSRRFDVVVDLAGAFTPPVDFEREWAAQGGPATGGLHLLERLVEAMRREGFDIPGDGIEPVPLPPESAGWAARLAARMPPGPKVLVHPFAGSQLKLPPDETWRATILELGRLGANPLVTSGESARDEQRAIAIAADTEAVVLPRVPVMHLVGLARHCESSVMGDTGLLQLVAMDGGRWTGLFGPTSPALASPCDAANGETVTAMPPGGRACETCWKRAAAGIDYCPFFLGSSCLSQLDGRTIARRVGVGWPQANGAAAIRETGDPPAVATNS